MMRQESWGKREDPDLAVLQSFNEASTIPLTHRFTSGEKAFPSLEFRMVEKMQRELSSLGSSKVSR
jgi:hypothetical protein